MTNDATKAVPANSIEKGAPSPKVIKCNLAGRTSTPVKQSLPQPTHSTPAGENCATSQEQIVEKAKQVFINFIKLGSYCFLIDKFVVIKVCLF
jgi:hypothetical protein